MKHHSQRCGRGRAELRAVFGVLLLAGAAALGSQPPVTIQASPPVSPADTSGGKDSSSLAAAGERPQLMVVVKEIPKDDIIAVDDRMLETEPVEVMIADAFRSRGFEVVDAATATRSVLKDQLRRILEGDDRAAAEVGLAAEADVVVAGTLQEWNQAPTQGDGASPTPRLRLAARAVNVGSSIVMGSSLLELPETAGGVAVRQRAADSLASELSAAILAAWRPRTNITMIYAENADDQRVELLKSTVLQETNGVDSVTTVSLADRSAVIEVFSVMPPDELLTRIYHCVTAIPFVVKNFSGNRIDIRFEDTPGPCQPDRE